MNEVELSKKRVLILGAGKTGLSAANFLIEKAGKVLISEVSNLPKDYENKIINLKNKGVIFEFNKNSDAFLNQADLIVTSPGISPFTEVIKKINFLNIPVISDIELASYFIKKPIIAITGTNGKTTTTHLISNLITTAGKKAVSCGNIGKPILDVISQDAEYYVLEISSYQIYYSPTFSPATAVCLNITQDHLDWHKSFEHYLKSKEKLFLNQKNNSWAILNYSDNNVKNLNVKNNIFYFTSKNTDTNKFKTIAFVDNNFLKLKHEGNIYNLINKNDLKIIGTHNIENSLASSAVTCILGIQLDFIREGLRNFKGVEHRLELVRKVQNKEFYNDSKATNPESTVKAIEAIKENKNNKSITLILGGRDKNTDLGEMIESINKNIQEIILLGEAKERFLNELRRVNFSKKIKLVNNINEAVLESLKSNTEIVLFSPACSSFDMFKNFEERGNVFKEIITKI